MLRTLFAAILALAVSAAGAQVVNRPVAAGAISNPGTSLPSTCAVGYLYFKSNSTAGQNLHLCTAANTWTQMTGGNLANPVTPAQGGSGVANSKNLTWSASLTFAGTDATTMTFPTTSATIARTDASNTFTGDQTLSNNLIVSGVGPHGIAAGTNSDIQLYFLNSAFTGGTNAYGLVTSPTLTVPANGVGVGYRLIPTINKAGSGTHADFTTLQVDPPNIGAGAATLTNSTALKVTGAPGSGTNPRAIWVTAGVTQTDGGLVRTIVTETNASRTVASTDTHIIANRAGTVTLTLGTATAGRELTVRTIQAQTVVSASSNVVPCVGGSAGTAILAATAGKWAYLVGDGSNWQIQMCN